MLHTKFRENRPAGSREEDFWVFFFFFFFFFLFFFYHKWAWRTSWLCDPILRSNFRSPYPWMLHIEFHFDLPSIFREEDLRKLCMDDTPAHSKAANSAAQGRIWLKFKLHSREIRRYLILISRI